MEVRLRFRALATLARVSVVAIGSLTSQPLGSETLQELPTNGLVFTAPPGVVLDRQEVVLSTEAILMRYWLTDTAETPTELSIALRLPDLDFSDPDVFYAIPAPDPVNFIGASLRIDNKPIPLSFRQTASLHGKDVIETLKWAKLSLVPVATFQNEVAAMTLEMREELAKRMLIRPVGTTVEGKPLYFPAWTVRTELLRKLKLEPGKPVEIALRYVPSIGVTRDTVLRKTLRDQKSLATQVREKRRAYCIDDTFLSGVDALSGPAEAKLVERRMRVQLRPEGETDLPVRYLRMIVDKGKPQRIASFCSENMRRISATVYEAELKDTLPKPVFDILIVEKGN